MRDLSLNELPPEFFQVSLDDYRRMKEQLQQESQDKALLTRATRERLKNFNRRVFRYTLIRVRLPQDNLLIQVRIHLKLSAWCKLVSNISSPWEIGVIMCFHK